MTHEILWLQNTQDAETGVEDPENPGAYLRAYSARQDRLALEAISTEGRHGPDALKVTPGGGRTINIGPGRFAVAGDDQANQGVYLCDLSVTENVDLGEHVPGTGHRIVRVSAKVHDTAAGALERDEWDWQVDAGDPVGLNNAPQPPALPPSAMLVADVRLSASMGSIEAAHINQPANHAEHPLVAGRYPPLAAPLNRFTGDLRVDGHLQAPILRPGYDHLGATEVYKANDIWTSPGVVGTTPTQFSHGPEVQFVAPASGRAMFDWQVQQRVTAAGGNSMVTVQAFRTDQPSTVVVAPIPAFATWHGDTAWATKSGRRYVGAFAHGSSALTPGVSYTARLVYAHQGPGQSRFRFRNLFVSPVL